jgi:hypothetical protein
MLVDIEIQRTKIKRQRVTYFQLYILETNLNKRIILRIIKDPKLNMILWIDVECDITVK